METDSATRVALARWAVIAPATDERLTSQERGRLLSELAAEAHRDPDGRLRHYDRRTLYRWLAVWRNGGFDALKPKRRRDAGVPKTPAEVLELAEALRREAPARSAAHICDILQRMRGVVVSARTLQRHFAREGLDRARLEGRHRAYGRFEARAVGDLWTADAWDGPPLAELGGRHAQLFSILDDHSRLICHGAFYSDVSEWSFQACLQAAIARRGIPRVLYVDQGGAFTSGQLRLICGRLGVRVTHTPPYRPQGRGKKERWYRTVAESFAVEATLEEVDTLTDLNRFFAAWCHQVYHHRIHRGIGETPLERYQRGPSSLREAPSPDQLRRAFEWEQTRTVTRTATVSLHGNTYAVDASLAGRKVQLRYHPGDLEEVTVWHQGQPAGRAVVDEIRTHVDPKLRDVNPPEVGPATGIAYLEVLAQDHAQDLREGFTYQPPSATTTTRAPTTRAATTKETTDDEQQ